MTKKNCASFIDVPLLDFPSGSLFVIALYFGRRIEILENSYPLDMFSKP
jgi:hypothetical protein